MDTARLNVAINVTNFDASVRFYRDVLGCAVATQWDTDDGPGMILTAGPGRSVELFGPPWGARQDKRPPAGVELAFDVDDAEQWERRLRDAGVPIARELVDNPWGDRSLGINDPDGVRVWLVEITDPGYRALVLRGQAATD